MAGPIVKGPCVQYPERISSRLTGKGAQNVSPKNKKFFKINMLASKEEFCDNFLVFPIDNPFKSKCGKKIFSFNSSLQDYQNCEMVSEVYTKPCKTSKRFAKINDD